MVFGEGRIIMKSLLISIKPKWCAKIMNGNKTIEVRKNKALATAIQKLIDENGYADIYVYCSKDDDLGRISDFPKNKYFVDCVETPEEFKRMDSGYNGKGKVVFKFRCYKVEEHKDFGMFPYSKLRYDKTICLDQEEIEDYGFIEGKGYVPLYAIHISDLEIFDKPKELREFKRCTEKICIFSECHKYMHCLKPLTKAPQNFCYLEEN